MQIFDQGPAAPCPSPFNMAQYVLQAGLETPDKIALAVLTLSGAERWSYAKLRGAVLGLATKLLQEGVAPGDRVLLRVGNSVAFPISYLASIAVGALPVPTSAMLTVAELDKIAAEIQPRLLIAEPGIAVPQQARPTLGTADLAQAFTLPPATFQLGDPNRAAYLVYTSGTSGVPRAVTHAHRAIWARRMMWDGWYGLQTTDRVLHAGAFNWTYTLGTGLMDPWSMGATALIPGPGVNTAQLALLLKRHDATIFAAAPGVYRQMLRATLPALPKLRHGLSAGEKLPEIIRQRWGEATGTAIHEAFGMSECSTFVSGSPDQPASGGALGRPQRGRRVAILKDGTLGVSTSDPGLMVGYWSKDRGGPDPVTGDWFSTGDMMQMAEDGALRYLGRGDDMMNAGGFRVSPLEVENAFNTHPLVQDCAAVEQRLSEDTSLIALHYVSEDEIPEDQLQEHAKTHLARYKQPRLFHRATALPRGGNGKLLRKALR